MLLKLKKSIYGFILSRNRNIEKQNLAILFTDIKSNYVHYIMQVFNEL